MKFKVGDKVIIDDPKSIKNGLVGKVKTLFVNGALVKFDNDRFTPVKFTHLKRYENK